MRVGFDVFLYLGGFAMLGSHVHSICMSHPDGTGDDPPFTDPLFRTGMQCRITNYISHDSAVKRFWRLLGCVGFFVARLRVPLCGSWMFFLPSIYVGRRARFR